MKLPLTAQLQKGGSDVAALADALNGLKDQLDGLPEAVAQAVAAVLKGVQVTANNAGPSRAFNGRSSADVRGAFIPPEAD